MIAELYFLGALWWSFKIFRILAKEDEEAKQWSGYSTPQGKPESSAAPSASSGPVGSSIPLSSLLGGALSELGSMQQHQMNQLSNDPFRMLQQQGLQQQQSKTQFMSGRKRLTPCARCPNFENGCRSLGSCQYGGQVTGF